MKEFVDKLIEMLEQEITALKTGCPTNVDFDKGIYKAQEIVNKLADEYNNGWIPVCSGVLPKKEGYYYAKTINKKNGFTDCRICLWKQDKGGKMKWFRQGKGYEVVAWQPLPEEEVYAENICKYKDCPYNTGGECPAAEGCPGFE